MVYKNLLIQIILRVTSIVLLSLLTGWIYWDTEYYYIAIFCLIIVFCLAFRLIYFLNYTNRNLAQFFLSVQNEDSTLKIPESFEGKSFDNLKNGINKVNQIIKDLRLKYQQKEILSDAIIENAAVGILTLNSKGRVEGINRKGRNLLGVHHLVSLKALRKIDSNLEKFFEEIQPGDNRIIETQINKYNMHLIVNCSSLLVSGESYKLLSFTDIKNQLDAKELESWQSLINVLTHEIMNSVSPLTCLSENLAKSYHEMKPDTLISSNILNKTQTGLKVIKEQGEGLMHFVESYRELSRIPKPQVRKVFVIQLFQHLKTLLCLNQDPDINYQFSVSGEDLSIVIDEQLIIQVMVNLIKNAQAAIIEKGLVKIEANCTEDGLVQISIEDNGSGVKPEDMHNIFIPFFTTKENGSGIGLSIARSIIRLHDANISLESVYGEGTRILILFQNSFSVNNCEKR